MKLRTLHVLVSAVILVTISLYYFISSTSLNWIPPPFKVEVSYKQGIINELQYGELDTHRDNIYFIITRKMYNLRNVPINPRQACGIESAAKYHPDRNIYVLIVTPNVAKKQYVDMDEPAAAFLKYPNVKVRIIHVESFLRGTPLELLITPLSKSEHIAEHTSDILRYAVLYLYPGVYLDTDVILLKELPQGENYIGVESDNWIGAGIISFGKDRVGREIAEEAARQLIKSFDGKEYSASGPKVVTRSLFNLCQASTRGSWVFADKGRLCNGFQILPRFIFYGLPLEKRLSFFTKGQTPQMRRLIKNSTSVHYWNHLTADLKANEPNIPFYDIVQDHCPKVFQHAGHLF